MPVATPAADLGRPCPDYRLPDVFGGVRCRDDDKSAQALLVVFFCAHCPYARAVEDRIIALHRALAPQGLATVFICSNDAASYPEDAPAGLRAQAEQKHYPFPYLIDEDQRVARAFDAACTPDLFVFDAKRLLRYRGRLDDNWKNPQDVTKHELKDAIQAILRRDVPAAQQFPSLGCSIKWKQSP
jgi:peroxiredoxin